MSQNHYNDFLNEITRFIPRERIYTDELRRLAWGTDAGFYRLIPQIVVRSDNEQEVSRLLAVASRLRLPVTFRAAGTSLSGQAVSDSILVVAGKHWERYSVSDDHSTITLQPGLVGQRVNEILAPYGRKFAPDPASIRSAMVGGIVMNNASGMNCGTHANSDRMLLSARIVLADGTVVDTGNEASREAFRRSHPRFLEQLCLLRDRVRSNTALMARIARKYAIKNVTGLNILPFVRFDDPFDIMAHLMVGSEGTLAFLSQVTMKTEYDYPFKASAMLYFRTIREACEAVVAMKPLDVKSAELLDYKSLSSVNDPNYLEFRAQVGEEAARGMTAVLTEVKERSRDELSTAISRVSRTLEGFDTFRPVRFTDRPEEYSQFWAIRSGIFPSVGGTRKPGTTCLIEDVAFHIEDLPDATADLQELIRRHGYDDACIYGHALEGNYHFIINQSFDTDAEVARYEQLMEDVKQLVVDRYDGSLKAEHGTGRNMAPYVRYEWGDDAYAVMKAVKSLFDPLGLLNPGVILNDDPRCHLKNFKPLPRLTTGGEKGASVCEKTDRCIECGFCEVNCLTCGFTLSSRQRIVINRELSRLQQTGDDPRRLALLRRQYKYLGNATCAGDGLCSMSCPMGINVGDLTHIIRQEQLPEGSFGYRVGDFAARHFAGMKSGLRPVLHLAAAGHSLLGTTAMSKVTSALHSTLGIPLWTPAMPHAFKLSDKARREVNAHIESPDKVVYFPSCINQTMGQAHHAPTDGPLVNKMVALLHKAGYEVIYPDHMERLCCGTIWESKGMLDIADRKTAELEEALWEASCHGRYPVLCDQSPCLHRMREKITRMKLYEPAEFIWLFLRERLDFVKTDRAVALHITCSMRKMGLKKVITDLAALCSPQVVIPEGVGCCGFAGDRGFTHPEVNAYALRKLKPQLEKARIVTGYSNSRTCEIGLTTNTGVPYQSIVYLVDECTTPKKH